MSTRQAPLGAVGNLRFTRAGVYAEYLVSGLPFVFLSKEWQNTVAAEHAELWRNLPSGASLSGLTVPVPARNLTRRMLFAHHDLDPATATPDSIPATVSPWSRHCRTWEPAVSRHRPRRRIYWLSIPLDYGLQGQTTTGTWQQMLNAVIGRDTDTESSLAAYRERAAQMVATLPSAFFVKPVGVEQIWWHWNYCASRGVWPHPLPNQPYDPHARLPAAAFTPVHFDPAAAQLRGRRWRAARTDAEVFVRTYRDADDEIPDAYQAFIALHEFPDSGIAWPKATIFKQLDDLTRPDTTLDWTIHTTFKNVDAAVSTAQNTVVNIEDQYRQRGRHALTDDELVRKRASGKELISELKRGTAERGVNVSVVIAAAAADAQTLNNAVESVIRTQRRNNIGSKRWKGSQPTLWQAFNPGTEQAARLGEFRNPTTTGRFAKFVPLLTNKLGNNTGVPLGMSVTSPGLRDVVLEDLLNAPARENPMNIVLVGSPGRGKSQCAKNLIRSWLALGAGMHLFDPTDAREHERALNDFENKIVIDIQRMNFSLDGLRVFPYQEAAEKTIDHLLPQLGFSPLTRQAKRLAGLLSPESRETRGIGSTMQLIRYLRDLPAAERTSADEDLLIGLEGLSSERLLRPLFDETLPTPDLASTQCVIWNFAGLDLPTVTEEYVAHLHEQTTPGQRTAQTLWGLGADLAVSIFFARPEQPDMLVVEECAPWAHSPGGQKTANKVITQGRKAWTGFAGISQQPIKDIKETLKHEFIDQRVCFGFKDAELARATLQWCGRDLNRHPDLLTNYVSNTSPVQLVDHGDDSIDTRHGKVIAGREGEAWFLDEFGGFGKFRAFEAPTAELAQRYDTNPHRNRRRNQARSA